ncbi:hypothetical protein [Tetragenococcus halophilus]|uniref:hypothetical protein n=1 Tax=Tetragenococcus halophilus TaxID=51669 RepID=UPI001D1311E7|nr:hypothetical protein [Tetragenococcus halophilus]
MKKTTYLILLFVALILFLGGLNNGNYMNNLIAILIGFIVYSKGNKILFEDYNQRKQKKTAEAKAFRESLRNKK